MKPIYPLILLLLLAVTPTLANKLNIQYVGHEQSGDGYITLEINVSWENSWRDPVNWDAAWVFVKYRQKDSTQAFNHLYLTPDGHWAPSLAEIIPGRVDEHSPWDAGTNPITGAFIQRRPDFLGGGHVNFQGVKLRADISQIDFANMDTYDITVFGIEMVYVPEGSFYLGSGGSESGGFKDGSSNDPFQVSSEAAINIGTSAGSLWGSSTGGDNAIGPSGTLPAAYPKGYNGFYVMKYQVSQAQYAAFLNSLAVEQAGFLQPGNFGDFRQGVTQLTDVYVTNTPFVAQNFLTWQKGVAYLDWAGLRPLTESEYEKIMRGEQYPLSGEYAWGSLNAYPATTIQNIGEDNEAGSFTVEGGGGDEIYGFFDEETETEYVVHAFTSVGEHTLVLPSGVGHVDVLIVAGGGGGSGRHGGGGGAGGLVFIEGHPVDPLLNLVYVGDGGAGGAQEIGECCNTTRSGSRGENSLFGDVVAYGGGGGMSWNAIHGGNHNNQEDGGSGGGGGARGNGGDSYGPGESMFNQGFNGGPGYSGGSANYYNHGGGGGAGQVGGSGKANETGSGGDGLYFGNYFGESYGESGWFAGGGAGGSHDPTPTSFGVGGLGGGADSQTSGAPYYGLPGMSNTGGGGSSGIRDGGNTQTGPGGDGGSGIVLVRYPVPDQPMTNVAFGDYPLVQGPLRVGSFASGSTNRTEAGATYWGIMEMSGNLWERVVTVGNDAGRAFTGLHGDGELAPVYGFATTENWPGWHQPSGYVEGTEGSGFRGGSWFTGEDRLRTSDRHWAAKTETLEDDAKDFGIRGVRTAPQQD